MQGKRQLVGRVHPPGKPPADDKDHKKPMCGAYSRRSGQPCKNYAMPNGRCRMHGGKATGNPQLTPEQSRTCAIKHGIYADVGLLDDEYPVYDGIMAVLGTLNEEIHMARVRLRRAYAAQRRLDAARTALADAAHDKEEFIRVAIAHQLLTVDEIEEHDGQVLVGPKDDKYLEDVAKSKVVKKLHDYSQDIYKFTQLIGRLEQARKELMASGTGGEDFVRQLAEDLRDFNDNAMGLVPVDGGGGLGSGNYPGLAEAGNGAG